MPKDGPSAGVTMFTALVVAAHRHAGAPRRRDDRRDHAARRVLPVGGIKEKVLAAHRAGIKRVIIPERNRKDLLDVPEQPRNEIEIQFVKRMDELLPLVLTEMPKLGVMSAPVAAAAARRRPRPPEL